MKFSNVTGQKALKSQLINTVKENRVSHAQMFAGPEGAGGLALALAYSQYICCENRSDNDSCGTCRSCIKYEKLLHPDLHFVFPVVNTSDNKKAASDDFLNDWRTTILDNPYINLNRWIETIASENKQGGIFERESGEILRKLSLKTYESEFKIMIIWMPEKMNTTTANKLLKILEEPPAKTLFLLISENPGQLLTTIISRCQYVKVPPIAAEDIKASLEKQVGANQRIDEVTRVAGGNYFKALELINQHDDNSMSFDSFTKLMRFSYSRKFLDLIAWADEVAGTGRENQKKFLNTALRLVRENFILNIANKSIVYLNDEETSFSSKFHPYINEANVYQLNDEFNRAFYHIEANGNARIIFLDLALKVVKLIRPQ
jgi:DNA polymerase III subunit delta'